MAVKKNGKATQQKNSTMNVNNSTVNVVNVESSAFGIVDFDGILESVKNAQKANSLYAEFNENPAVLAITGAALQMRNYSNGTVKDYVIHLKVVFKDAPENVRIMTLRGFYKKNDSGAMLPQGLAYQEAIELVKKAGVVITKIHNIDENPNLKSFGGWSGLAEPLVVVVTTRESNGRFWPNRISKYEKIETNAVDLIADVLNMEKPKEGDAQ
jgi:hypothetical protein